MTRRLICTLYFGLLLASCGGEDSDPRVPLSSTDPRATYVATITPTYDNATITPETLSLSGTVDLAAQYAPESAYAINGSEDLDALNARMPEDEELSFEDIDYFSYFLVRAVDSCVTFFELGGTRAEGSRLSVVLHQFDRSEPLESCSSLEEGHERYLVLRGQKEGTALPVSPLDPADIFTGTRTHTFTADIDPAGLAHVDVVESYSGPEESRVIDSPSDLDQFNLECGNNVPLVLEDLDRYTYFLVRNLSYCTDYIEHRDFTYDPATGELQIRWNHFVDDRAGEYACPAVEVFTYEVYRAPEAQAY